MMFWILLWKISFVVAVVLFAVMAVLTTIGGAFDIRKLLRRLGNRGEK